jgi:hypothetical protein
MFSPPWSPPQHGATGEGEPGLGDIVGAAGVSQANAAWSSRKTAIDLTCPSHRHLDDACTCAKTRGLHEGPPDVSTTMAHHHGAKRRNVSRNCLIYNEPSGDRTQDPLIKSRGAALDLFDI